METRGVPSSPQSHLVGRALVGFVVAVIVATAFFSQSERQRNKAMVPTLSLPWLPTTVSSVRGVTDPTVVHHNQALRSSGSRVWLITLRNETGVDIGRPRVALSLFDFHGTRLLETTGHSDWNLVPPGEQFDVSVLVSQPPAEAVRAEISPIGKPAEASDRVQVELEVTDFHVRKVDAGRFTLTGDVRNPLQVPVRFAQLLAVGRDGDGTAVAMQETYATHPDLAPGASSGFGLNIDLFVIAEPATWEVRAVARP